MTLSPFPIPLAVLEWPKTPGTEPFFGIRSTEVSPTTNLSLLESGLCGFGSDNESPFLDSGNEFIPIDPLTSSLTTTEIEINLILSSQASAANQSSRSSLSPYDFETAYANHQNDIGSGSSNGQFDHSSNSFSSSSLSMGLPQPFEMEMQEQRLLEIDPTNTMMKTDITPSVVSDSQTNPSAIINGFIGPTLPMVYFPNVLVPSPFPSTIPPTLQSDQMIMNKNVMEAGTPSNVPVQEQRQIFAPVMITPSSQPHYPSQRMMPIGHPLGPPPLHPDQPYSHDPVIRQKIETERSLMSMNRFQLEQDGWTSYWPNEKEVEKMKPETKKRKRQTVNKPSQSKGRTKKAKVTVTDPTQTRHDQLNHLHQLQQELHHQIHNHHHHHEHAVNKDNFYPTKKGENRMFFEIKNTIQQIPQNGDPTRFQSNGRCLMACESCKRRKMRCTNEFPTCSNCVKRGTCCKYPAKVRTRGRAKNSPIQVQQEFDEWTECETTFNSIGDKSFPSNSATAITCPPVTASKKGRIPKKKKTKETKTSHSKLESN